MANPRNKMYVTHAQLIGVLMSMDHAQPIGLVTRTEPKMRKTDNPYHGRITKVTECNVFVNCDYEKAVNRQLGREHKEQTFQAGQRAFAAERRSYNGKPTPVLDYVTKENVRKTYLEVHFRGHLKTESRFILDGRTAIDKSEFNEFMNHSSGSEHQGLNSEIVVRTYDTRNIIEVRYSGTDYIVIQ